jgi:hypothetical protein
VRSVARLAEMQCQAPGEQGDPSSSLAVENNSDIRGYLGWNRCRDVTIKDSKITGIGIGETGSVTFTRNTVTKGPVGGGISITASTSFVVSDNTFTGLDTAFDLAGGSGVVSGNTFTDNATSGMAIGSAQDFFNGPIEVRGNVFLRNGTGPDFLVRHGGLMIDNDAGQPVITVASNRTQQNIGYGIWASGSAKDGGGNTSIDDEMGCFGVKC